MCIRDSHDADPAVAELLRLADEVGELGPGGGLSGGEAHLLGAAVLLEDPADPLGRHRGVVDVAALAVFLHAEDAVVVADGPYREVDAFLLRLDALDDRTQDQGASPLIVIQGPCLVNSSLAVLRSGPS